MKDKLRELAAEWLRKGEFSKNSGAPRCGGQMIEDAAELLAILDAEADSGAVGELSVVRRYALAQHTEYASSDESAHPARSGVVSDEDVKEFKAAMFPALENMKRCHIKDALEHFAKGERHER